MKIQLTLTALNELAEVEGTVDEIAQLIASLAGSKAVKITKPTSTPVTSTQVIEPRSSSRQKQGKQRALRQTNDFIQAIYLYEPNPSTDSGRGAYIASQIMKGETLNIEKLARKAQGRRQTVINTVRRMRENGAIIDVTKTTIKLVSIPNPPYQAKGYNVPQNASSATRATSRAIKASSSDKDLLSNLTNIRLV